MWTIARVLLKRQVVSRHGWLQPLCTLLMSSCISSTAFDELKTAMSLLQSNAAEQQTALSHLKEDNRRIWRSMRCTNQQVADFVSYADQCQSGQCPQRNLDSALNFMSGQKHVMIRLRPGQGPENMAPLRVDQLGSILKEQEISSVSRMLILTMAVGLGRDESVRLPEEFSEKLIRYVRRDLKLVPTTGLLGPFPVNCEGKSQILENYSKRIPADRPAPGEPKSREPQVVLWLFKVDC